MRKAECLNLKWSEVSKAYIRILSFEDDERTKSGEYLVLPLNENAHEALVQIRKQHGKLLAGDQYSSRAYGWDDEYVLPRVPINSLGRAFARDAAPDGIRGHLQRLRHTFGTHFAVNGPPPVVITELLGQPRDATNNRQLG